MTFNPGQVSRTITIQVNGDVLDEINETFFVNLSNASNATIADPQALGTINDDDAFPTVSVGDAVVVEGDSGTATASFTVSLNAPSGRALFVDYATADGTAVSPADYVATNGTLTFAAGETSKTVTVVVNGDQLDEIDETFTLGLSNGVNVTIGDGSGLGTITDDDALPALTIDDVTVAEGDSGAIAANFTVTLSAASGRWSRSTTHRPTAPRPRRATTRRPAAR